MDKKHKINQIFSILEKEYRSSYAPVNDFQTIHRNDPFRILVSAVLSPRTKDAVTVKVTQRLFEKVHNFKELIKVPISELERLIYPVGFYKTKAKNLHNISKIILDRYHGRIPDSVEELISLPGIGLKIATLIVTTVFGRDDICVDTHVHRISNRLGIVSTSSPEKTRIELKKILPKRFWKKWNKLLVSFGQRICKPILPLCSLCRIGVYCDKIGVNKSG